MGPGPGRMHVRAARRAGSRRRHAAVPHRHAADLPAHGLFRDLHVPPGAQGLLFERLASASIAGRRRERPQSVHAGEARANACRRSAAHFLGGAARSMPLPGTAFATPTVNGYRRFRPNSLAPDRAGWGLRPPRRHDPGAGRPGDPATQAREPGRRAGRQSLSLHASQIVAGLDGVARQLDPGPPDDEPYAAERAAAAEEPGRGAGCAGAASRCSARELGEVFIDYFLKLKRNEAGRFQRSLEEDGASAPGDETDASGSRTSISISSEPCCRGSRMIAKERSMTMLEKIGSPPTRLAARRSTIGTSWCRRIASIG